MPLTTDLSMNLIRPAIAGTLASAYGWSRNGKFDFKNAAAVAGSVWAADMTTNVVLKQTDAYSRNKSVKSFEHMVAGPAISGGIYTGAFMYLYPQANTPMLKTFMIGAVADAASERLSMPLKYALAPDTPDEF